MARHKLSKEASEEGRKKAEPYRARLANNAIEFALRMEPIIREHIGDALDRKTYKQVADSLNDAGVPTFRKKGKWHGNSVSRCIMRVKEHCKKAALEILENAVIEVECTARGISLSKEERRARAATMTMEGLRSGKHALIKK